jgi:hypothetical protein
MAKASLNTGQVFRNYGFKASVLANFILARADAN